MTLSYQRKIWLFMLVSLMTLSPREIEAQVISISSLIKLHSFNQEQIEDFALKNGYSYRPSQFLHADIEMHTYGLLKKNLYRSINIQYYKNKELVKTEFTTYSQNDYVYLKNQIKQNGYVFGGSDTWGDIIVDSYKNILQPKYLIQLTKSYDNDLGASYTVSVINDLPYKKMILETLPKQ